MTAGHPNVRPKSYTYRTGLAWAGGRGGTLGAEGKPSFRVASPPEFKGEAGVWSPEDLFVASVNACTMTTFISLAERAKLNILDYTSEAEGLLELVDGAFRFTRVDVKPVVQVAEGDVTQAKATMHQAHEKCLIANSMKCRVIVQADIRAS